MSERRYAEHTQVSVSRSRDEIERTLERFGATADMWMRDAEKGTVVMAFRRGGYAYRFTLRLPDPQQFRTYERRVNQFTTDVFERKHAEVEKAVDQETRRLFRSLANYVKALLDAIDSGIVTAEEALLPYLLLPTGETMAEHVVPQLTHMLESGQAPSLARALLPPGQER